MMPWWGWLIVGTVLWMSGLAVGAWVYVAHKVTKAQREMFADFDVDVPSMHRALMQGSPVKRPDLGPAFGPRHRQH